MKDLNNLRKELDDIDSQLIVLIERRVKVVRKVGIVKKRLQCPIIDNTRETEIINRLSKKTKIIHKSLINEIWSILFKLAYAEEK